MFNFDPTVVELGWPKITSLSAKVLHPSDTHWVSLGNATHSADGWILTVPLSDGCGMVQATLGAEIY